MIRFADLMKRPATRAVLILLLVGWVCWLRGPSLTVPMWNVDETIHATVAEVLLDGGTLYRDAIDQRTPLTYFVTTAVFAVTGSSLTALRIQILLMICGTALALGRIAFRVNGLFTGFGAALVFAAFSSYLLLPQDTLAAHTEWFVVFFTTAAAWCFLTGSTRIPTIKRCFATGEFLGMAKQGLEDNVLHREMADNRCPSILYLRAAGFRLLPLLGWSKTKVENRLIKITGRFAYAFPSSLALKVGSFVTHATNRGDFSITFRGEPIDSLSR